MKSNSKSVVRSLFVLLFLSQNMLANNKIVNQKGPGLEISSTLILNGQKISNYTLIVYDENQVTDTIFVEKEKMIFLKLGFNHNYTFRYLKKGFLERVVLIDTKINEERQNAKLGFDFEIEMIHEDQGGNTISNLPVALIHYDDSEKQFEYSREYHRQVRGKEIKED